MEVENQMQDVNPTPVDGDVAAEDKIEVEGQTPAAPVPEVPATETLYIQNLNEKIDLAGADSDFYLLCIPDSCVQTVIKQSLRALFKSYGKVLDVVAHYNIRMRGQAFVSFESPEVAARAVKEVQGFPLYGKSMVRSLLPLCNCARTSGYAFDTRPSTLQQVSFARTRSDAVVQLLDESGFEEHKKERRERKRLSIFLH